MDGRRPAGPAERSAAPRDVDGHESCLLDLLDVLSFQRAPPIQAVQIATSSRPAGGMSLWTTMSAICSRPPGLRTRNASRKTASLSGQRLITPLEMNERLPSHALR